MLNDTIAAFVPIEVPTNQRVKGIIAINKIINGIDLTIFTIKPIIKLITDQAFSYFSLFSKYKNQT